MVVFKKTQNYSLTGIRDSGDRSVAAVSPSSRSTSSLEMDRHVLRDSPLQAKD